MCRLFSFLGLNSQKDFSFNQLKIYYSSKGYHLNDETLVDNLHLKTDDGRYNFLAELLYDENRISIKVARFQGEDKSVLLEKVNMVINVY